MQYILIKEIECMSKRIAVLSLLALISSEAYCAKASWYGGFHNGRRTASGEIFNENKLTAASNTHKMGTKLLVTNVSNGKSVKVKVNDTGGFAKYGRTLDLSKAAFKQIADPSQGIINVNIKQL